MRRKRGLTAPTLVVALIALAPQRPTPARADSGYGSTLAPTTFVPSVGVVATPNPSVDWGDGTRRQPSASSKRTSPPSSIQLGVMPPLDLAPAATMARVLHTGALLAEEPAPSPARPPPNPRSRV
jgi:hypothetical protein